MIRQTIRHESRKNPIRHSSFVRHPGLKTDRLDGAVYRVLWDEAIKARPDWVLITSWNEWHEGSEIEPSWEDGDKYLQLTGDNSARFRPGKD